MIQVIVPPHLIQNHKSTLIIGNTYIMPNFKVPKSDFSFKATNHKFKLIFCGASSAKISYLLDIPQNHMKLISSGDILAGKFQYEFLVGN